MKSPKEKNNFEWWCNLVLGATVLGYLFPILCFIEGWKNWPIHLEKFADNQIRIFSASIISVVVLTVIVFTVLYKKHEGKTGIEEVNLGPMKMKMETNKDKKE